MAERQADFRVAGLDCDSEAAAILRGLQGFNGINDLQIYARSAKVIARYDDTVTSEEAIKSRLAEIGFKAQTGRAMVEQPKPWRNPKVITSALSGILLVSGYLLARAGEPPSLAMLLYVSAILIGGYYFGREALEDLWFEHEIGIELLMAVAAVVAATLGQFAEAAMLVFLYSMSEAAEGYTEEKTRSAIKALMDLAPKTALIKRGGKEVEISVEELAVGDVFLVKPGQSIPTDGEVIGGASSVNQAPVTGESVPIEKQIGATVFAGTLNEEGFLEVRAQRMFADNTISKIIHMVEEAQEQKGKSQRFIERFGQRYSPAVLAMGILLALIPPLLLGATWHEWIARATVFIVAAAPCALAISIPITLVASLGTGARNGVLIKGGLHVEELAKVKVIAFDKTGTITRGEPDVTDVVALPEAAFDEEHLISIAVAIESRSQHPLATAVVRYANERRIAPAQLDEFRSLTGAGASGNVAGRKIHIGSPQLFDSLGVSLAPVQEQINELQAAGKTVIILGDDRQAWALFGIQDALRPGIRDIIDRLHAAGIRKVAMLTGDNERTARAIAQEAGIDEFYANLKPEDKVARVRELAKQYGHVAMVGDGVNDAPALAEATVGIAMGAAGTDVALETADVALMADDLDKLVYAIQLAQRNASVVRQNLFLSTIVISVLVIGAIAGWMSLPIAVLGHEISEFVVIGSGLRMLRN